MADIITRRSLTEIEADIRAHSQYVTASIIAIGKALIEAKAQLAHGEWEGWLAGRVCFSQRTANNFMRIAREIGADSAMAALPYTKALALLDAPADEREAMAAEADATGRSAEAIRKAIRDRDAEKRRREQEEAARRDAEQQRDGYRAAAEKAARDAAEARRARDQAAKLSEQYNEALTEAQQALRAAQERPLPTVTVEVAPADYEAAKAAASQAEALRERAEQAERYAVEMETAAKAAQASARRLEARQAEHADDAEGDPFSARQLGEAVRAFMAAVGMVPGMGAYFFGLSAGRLAEYRPYVAVMRAWVEGAEAAISGPEAVKAGAIRGEA